MLVPANEGKEKIKKYEELLIKVRNLLKSLTKRQDNHNYDEIY